MDARNKPIREGYPKNSRNDRTSRSNRKGLVERILNEALNDRDKENPALISMRKKKKENPEHFGRFPEMLPNYMLSIDLLMVPEDNAHKYILSVVDAGSGLVGLEGMKSKTGKATLAAFKKIMARKILQITPRVNMDAGSEFSMLKKFLVGKGVAVKVGIPDRHHSTIHAEALNKIVGKVIFAIQHDTEFKDDHKNYDRRWLDLLPLIEKQVNNNRKKRGKATRKAPIEAEDFKSPKKHEAILPNGTKVRKFLEAPYDFVSGKKLHGNFRETDLRLEKKIRTITDHVVFPNNPNIFYLLSGFTRQHVFNIDEFIVV